MDQMHPSQKPSPPFPLESPSLNLNFSAMPWTSIPSPTLHLPTPTLEGFANTDWSAIHNLPLPSANNNNNTSGAFPAGLNSGNFAITPTRLLFGAQATPGADANSQQNQTSMSLLSAGFSAGFSSGLSPKIFPDMMSPGVSGGLAGTLPPQPSCRSSQSLSELFLTPEYPASTSPVPVSSVTNTATAASNATAHARTHLEPTQKTLPVSHQAQNDLSQSFNFAPLQTSEQSTQANIRTTIPASFVRQPALHPLPNGALKAEKVAIAAPAKKSRPANRRTAPAAKSQKVASGSDAGAQRYTGSLNVPDKATGCSAVEEAANAARAKAEQFAEERRRSRAGDSTQIGVSLKRNRDDSSGGEECNVSESISEPDGTNSSSDVKRKRYERRLELNRQSAAVSRVRRREYVKELEEKLVGVEKEKLNLESQVAVIGDENERLRLELKSLQSQLGSSNMSLKSAARAPKVSRGTYGSRKG